MNRMKKFQIAGMIGLFVLLLIAVGTTFAGEPAMMTTSFVDGLPMLGLAGVIINKTNLDGIFLNLKTTFNKAFDATPSVWQKIAMLVPSGGSQNDYKWLSNFPQMKKWIGEKQIRSLEGFSYTIVNDDWEATVEVDRNHIEDDNLGIYVPQAQMAGFSAKQLPDEIIIALVNGGAASLCYDGQYFFDTDHPVAEASVANKGAVALSVATLATAQASYGVVRTAMRKFKDDEGRPLNITPSVLLVGPALEDVANTLMNNERLEDGKQNPYKGTAEVVVDARISSDTAWYLLDTTKPVKPFIYQERKKPEFVQQTDMNSDNVFKRKKYLYGAEARAAGGYGFWQLAYQGNA